MARILFVVNQHPNEAFAITVARETAKLLRKAGHEIIWKKFKAEETMLGTALKKGKKIESKKITNIINQQNKIISGLAKRKKPDLTYNFHCTPHKSSFWAATRKRKEADFAILKNSNIEGVKGLRLIEIKAHYKKMPKSIIAKGPTKFPLVRKYFKKTTSHILTRKASLHPENYAKAIAAKIKQQIRTGTTKARGKIRHRLVKKSATRSRVRRRV